MNPNLNDPQQTTPQQASSFGETTPVPPVGPAPNNAPIAPEGPLPSKNKIVAIIASAVGGPILLITIAVIANMLFGGVSRSDYQEANTQLSSAREEYGISSNAITSTTSSFNATEESTQAKIDTAKTALDTFKTEHAKLSGLKAIKSDVELKDKFAAYETKAKEYIAFSDDYLSSFEKMIVVLPKDGEASATATSATYKQKIAEYEALSDISDPDLKVYITSVVTMLKEILPLVTEFESASTTSKKLELANKITLAARAGTTAGTTLSTNLNARFDAVSPRDALDDLVELTIQKIRS